MAKKRFSRLKAALQYLSPSGTAGENFTGDAPTGSQLRLFQDWRSGKREVNYTRSENSNPTQLTLVEIQPFAIPAAETERATVRFSKRAENGLAEAGISIADLGHLSAPLNEGTATLGFDPAQAIITVRGTGESNEVSKLTGRKYLRKGSPKSFTFPMGQSTANKTYKEARANIANKVKAASTTASRKTVSFRAEVYR